MLKYFRILLNSFKDFVKNGKLPGRFASTKSNFVRASKNMSVNRKGVLLRKDKFVALKAERDAIFGGKFNKNCINKLSFSRGPFRTRCNLEKHKQTVLLAWRKELCCQEDLDVCQLCSKKCKDLFC